MVSVFGMSNMAYAQSSEGPALSDSRLAAAAMPGEFVSIGNHEVTGAVQIVSGPEGAILLLSNDFMTSSGPDLRLVLRDSTGQAGMQVVAPLQQFQGAQQYMLELDEQTLALFDEVVVYCLKFHVDFGIAKLK